ncbi:MAG TPA: hypothetical protein VHQ47_07015 [Phycisphaerae bacterium]|jgi:hypothetical protein|nr:hypothetical protein [Phycisphaerae bacterium]
MLVFGKNYVVGTPEPLRVRGGRIARNDPRLAKIKAKKFTGEHREVKGVPVTYLGKPVTADMRKKLERRFKKTRTSARSKRDADHG